MYRLITRLYTDKPWKLHTDWLVLAGRGLDLLFIVIRQPCKGICPGICIHIGLRNVDTIYISPLGIPLGNSLCIQIFHRSGKYRSFRSDLQRLSILFLWYCRTAHFNGRTARLFQNRAVTHTGKTVDRIPTGKSKIAIFLWQAVLVNENIADRRQHSPGALFGRPALLKLHKLIIDRHRCSDAVHCCQQGIFRLDRRCRSVRCPVCKFCLFQLHHRRIDNLFTTLIHDEIAPHNLAVTEDIVLTIRLRGRNCRKVWCGAQKSAQRHTDITVLQDKRPIIQCDLFHGCRVCRPDISCKCQRL